MFFMSNWGFKVIHKENGGVSSARNAALDIASGQYIGFVDPDDFIALDFFERLYVSLCENDAGVAASGIYHVCDGYEYLNLLVNRLAHNTPKAVYVGNDVSKWVLSGQCATSCWDKLFKREAWGAARFPIGINLGEDIATVLDICAGAGRAVGVPEAIYYYRVREKSLSRGTVGFQRFREQLRATAIAKQQLLRRSPEEAMQIDQLVTYHNLVAYKELLTSTMPSANAENKGASRLFRLYNHAALINREMTK